MIVKRLRLAEEDERDPLHEMAGHFMRERPVRASVRIRSELTWEPPTDVIETENEIIVVVDIAGMNGTDISVVTDGTLLRIGGTRRGVSAQGIRQFHKLEIQTGPFERAIELPSRVDPAKVSAHYAKGFLEVRVRKLDPSEYVKKVAIE